MRNLFFTLYLLLSGTAFAQSKKVDNATKWITEEMTKVLSLSESEASEMAKSTGRSL